MSTKKIKKFKINLRFRDIVRNLKNVAKTCEITKEIEDLIDNEADRVKSIISPCAVFETLAKDKIHFEIGIETPPKWVAATFFLVSIGAGAENEIKSVIERNEIVVERVLHSVFMEGIEQSANFIYRIITNEAEDEDCELTPRRFITAKEPIEEILKVLPYDKIGVSYSDTGFQPQFTSCGVAFWVPVKKRRK